MRYSISDLEKLSGVQSHTIRIWEQRHGALVPHRSPGNTRYYDDQHVQRLLNIVSLNRAGLKISQICALSDEEINLLLQKDIDATATGNAEFDVTIAQLLNFGITYNEPQFCRLLSQTTSTYGVETTYEQILFPLLVRLGLMWQQKSVCPAQEHFISHLIRQHLFVQTGKLAVKPQELSSWVLFLPENETHDIALLFSNYLLRKAGKKVIYLGGNVPLSSLEEVIATNQVDQLLFFITYTQLGSEAQLYVNQLFRTFKGMKMYIAGSDQLIDQLHLPERMNWLKNIGDLQRLTQASNYE